jgi:tetratricopeptide (TPR) repeat protein
MAEFNLEEKFPNLRPIKSPPSLQLINGIGTAVYGRRDYDDETGTYVKTHWFCLVFLPMLALGAYRVADAERGWYFLGREPLSGLAKLWNWLLVLGIAFGAGGVFWYHHVSSADYRAGRRLAEAERLAAAGQVGEAAQAYRDVALGNSSRAGEAKARFKALLGGPIDGADPAEAAAAFRVAVEMGQVLGDEKEVLESGLRVADNHEADNPRGAFAVLEAVAPLAQDPNEVWSRRQPLLERLVELEPNNVQYLSSLAVAYEGKRQFDRCEALLAPHLDRLGTSEGARVLGQLYVAQGNYEKAFALLQPYAEGRLKRLHDAEQAYQDAVKSADDKLVEEIRSKKAPGFDYERAKSLGRDAQGAMVNEYINKRLKDDPKLTVAREAILREVGVVPVALDLGIVTLHRAQSLPDPAARKKELEQAEKTFLAIHGLAGDTDAYRLNLGQVYYWLGKHAEGKQQFDDLLKSRGRSFEMLLTVSQVLREVGSDAEARTLAEEAYEKETDVKKKQLAASLRAVMNKDLDDQIVWLQRTSLTDPHNKALLSAAEGRRAMQEGKNDQAATYLRQAIDAYKSMKEDETSLNNGAMAYLSLYQVTGDGEALAQAGEMLDKALALKPSDSILLSNAARSVLGAALRDVIGPAIDLKVLKTNGTIGHLHYLYADAAGQKAYQERVRTHKGVAKALSYYERLLLLAPKNVGTYHEVADLYNFLDDLEGQRRLLRRIDEAALDLEEADRETVEGYQGKKDEKHRKDLENVIGRSEAIAAEARRVKGATLAVALSGLAQAKMGTVYLGVEVNADEVVALAEEAYAAGPSAATRATLEQALLFRASQDLAKAEPEYAKMVKRAERSLAPPYLVAVALTRGGKPSEAALRNADVRRATDLMRETVAKFPEDAHVWIWAMLRDAHPDEAAKVAGAIANDKSAEAARAISLKLSNVNASAAFHAYWSLLAAGKEADGLEVLRKCAAKGAPLPFDP